MIVSGATGFFGRAVAERLDRGETAVGPGGALGANGANGKRLRGVVRRIRVADGGEGGGAAHQKAIRDRIANGAVADRKFQIKKLAGSVLVK